MKTEWQARSNWNLIVVALPNGEIREIRPETMIELESKSKLFQMTAKQALEQWYRLNYAKKLDDPWGTAVRMMICLVWQRSMKLYSPSGRLMGKARLVTEKRSIH